MAGLFWKSICISSAQPTFGMPALWRWIVRNAFQALQHVMRIGIRAEADVDAAAEELGAPGRTLPHCPCWTPGLLTTEVWVWAMISISAGVMWDAVAKHRVGAQKAVLEQALDRSDAATVLTRIPDIVHALRDMDVEADEAVVCLGHPVHRLIGERECRVSAEHGSNHAGVLLGCPLREVDVLLDGLVELLLAVALRCLIAEAGTDAELLAHILDCKEGARNLGEAA